MDVPTAVALKELSITVAICTNRLELYFTYILDNAAVLSEVDEIICVVDSSGVREREILPALSEAGVIVLCLGQSCGLSIARNRALDHCRTRYLIFVDDDATVTANLIAAFRSAFNNGAHAAGARLQPPPEIRMDAWFLAYGQYHYLGIHRPDRPVSVWGACMAVDVGIVRSIGLTFNKALGRTGRGLESGDDTTFLRSLSAKGYRVQHIESEACTHHISKDRLSFLYLLRRAFWQGRSEVRRRNARHGLIKEARRNMDGAWPSVLRIILSIIYISSVFLGMVVEATSASTRSEAFRA